MKAKIAITCGILFAGGILFLPQIMDVLPDESPDIDSVKTDLLAARADAFGLVEQGVDDSVSFADSQLDGIKESSENLLSAQT